MNRWMVPVAAAAAVLLLLGGLYWVAGPGSRANDNGFAGGDTGSPGSSEPGFPGTADPGGTPSDGPGDGPVGSPGDDPVDGPADPLAVLVDGYHVAGNPRQVSLHYTIGVPECYGDIALPVVLETARSVTVTLTRVPPEQDGDRACIELAMLKTVDITLDEPLGDRLVRDGSLDGAVVGPGSLPGTDPSGR